MSSSTWRRSSAGSSGGALLGVRLSSPFVLRTVDPPISALAGRGVRGAPADGQATGLGAGGRSLPRDSSHDRRPASAGARPAPRRRARSGSPRSTSRTARCCSPRRAPSGGPRCTWSAGEPALALFERGGLEPLEADAAAFAERLRSENHTLKRALTDPRLFSGIGNAYSDEILHRARLSPLKLTSRLSDEEAGRLHAATQRVLLEWTERLRAEAGDGFPEKVTAFRDGMAVHGRYRQPCPDCGTPIQRIRYAENETNYCPSCQTEGRLLADRGLSRLLKEDWPRSLDELDERLKS